MVRYSFPATIKGAPTLNADGDPVSEGGDVSFLADFQLRMGREQVKYSGSFIDVQYKLFVSSTDKTVFTLGAEVFCNNLKGIIVSIFPTKRNTEIWVQ